MTQTELSKVLHITQRAYSHYENGTRDIPLDILISIADFHNVSIDYLLNRTNDKMLHTLNKKDKIKSSPILTQ